ncbi:hypothetical protein FIBSPDRAFT_60370 [Athelia psychrophila]|uniref:DUF7918 domain-containing protein n=1 Tax=Athelia psychrophila TaxID=1759441 RepID=A0A166F589_9AGAM|nr:hypothetical protein FIBSPDRAFT_60370 [Fibularhizoctonia sp. CBS 109695]
MRIELQGLAAFIVCGGDEVPCHGIEKSEDGKSVVCWIASEVGKEFSVNWTKTRHISGDTEGRVQIDDMDCGGKLMRESAAPDYVYCHQGYRTSATTIKPFLFVPLKLTDDDQFLDTSPSTELGDIILSIYRIEITSITDRGPVAPPQEQQVHERTKKATVHRVKLGTEKACSSTQGVSSKNLDTHPFAKYVFKYRPIDVLQANGIAPAPVEETHNIIDEPVLAPEMIQMNDSVPPPAQKKRKVMVVPKEEAVSDEELEESGATNAAEFKALQDELRTVRSNQIKDIEDKLRNHSSPGSPDASALGDELRVLRSQHIKDLEERVHALRPKPSGSFRRQAKRVKVEQPAAEGFIPGEVVDLTEL